ncbi:MAG: response regulator [Anaerolineae bacterium]|nr:response regulator [Anaerolineae bacterium]
MKDDLCVVVVDDELPIRRMLRTALGAHGYRVIEAASGAEGLHAVADHHPDLILLDLGLPDMDGVEVIRQLRQWSQTPVVVLSVREREEDKVRALDSGADDYLTKPFGISELLARMRVSLRHSSRAGQESPLVEIEELRIDRAARIVSVRGVEIALTPTEYDLLCELARHAGKVLTHRHLLRAVWGELYEQETHLLRVNISNLRKKIEGDPMRPRYILTEAGVGYRLIG